ncbi:MAG: hypothetical protein OEZ02_05440, partial [Anaerolineae bacterium]|nr:hypothetical protein [Anaerolineae bacterium]
LFPEDAKDDSAPEKVAATITVGMDELVVLKARPRQAEEIAAFITRMSGGKQQLTRMDVMAEFGEKAYLLLMSKDQLVGLVGWKVEDLVARTDEIYLEEGLSLNDTVPFLISEMEKASRELQCEASLVFVSPQVAQQVAVWSGLGYEARGVESLTVNAWKDAAKEYLSDETILLFKQLRVDRVLKPI